jgi:hypothetical protein
LARGRSGQDAAISPARSIKPFLLGRFINLRFGCCKDSGGLRQQVADPIDYQLLDLAGRYPFSTQKAINSASNTAKTPFSGLLVRHQASRWSISAKPRAARSTSGDLQARVRSPLARRALR